MYIAEIALTEIRPPAQAARAEIDDAQLEELTLDVKRNGVLIPPHVRKVEGGYEIVAGHRRYLAACGADLASMRCLVFEAGEKDYDLVKLTENLFRQELSPVEEAAFYAEKFEEVGEDVDKVCRLFGKSRKHVEDRLLLLSGDGEILRALARKEIGFGQAQELNKIGDEAKRRYYLGWTISQGATVKLVRFWREAANATPPQGEAGPAAEAPAHPAPLTADDIYKCWVCGEKEPVYALSPVMMHQGCKAILERNSGIEAKTAEVESGS